MPTSSAIRLLEGMRATLYGWTVDDLITLYYGFGFSLRRGKKHDIAKHPTYPFLRSTIPRKHRSGLAKGYITHAIGLIDRLEVLQKGGVKDDKGTSPKSKGTS